MSRKLVIINTKQNLLIEMVFIVYLKIKKMLAKLSEKLHQMKTQLFM